MGELRPESRKWAGKWGKTAKAGLARGSTEQNFRRPGRNRFFLQIFFRSLLKRHENTMS